MVIRIRNELIDAIRLEMSQMLSQAVKVVVERFSKNLRVMAEKLSLAASNRFLLETIIRDPAETAEAANTTNDNFVSRLRRLAGATI